MSFVTEHLFEAIGYSKALIMVRGINNDSFSKIIASLSGYIRRKRMSVRVMTIISSQTFAYNLINNTESFEHKLLNESKNFKKHTSALSELEVVAMDN